MPDETQERLQKILARAGIASRRQSEALILEGRVTVNGRVVTRLGTKADPRRDDVRVDGRRIGAGVDHVYVLLNKPRGVLSTMENDPEHPTLNQYVTLPQRLYPVGRLDVTSEGLILLTDDGELANRLTHPRYEHEKEYRVTVNGRPSDETLDAWRRGVVLDDRRTAPARVDILRVDKEGSLLRVVMREGRKRQIRRVAALLGHPVKRLLRVRLGPLQLGLLEPGQWRYLTEKEIAELAAVKASHSSDRPKPDRRPSRGQGGRSDRSDRPLGTPARRKATRSDR